MVRDELPPNGGTNEPNVVDAALDDELMEVAKDIACPHCGSSQVQVVRAIAPDDAKNTTTESYKQGMAGAGLGGMVGALFGPAGVAAGLALGGLAGSSRGEREALKQRLQTSCPHCGHHGRGC